LTSIGKRIKTMRGNRGLTLKKVAAVVGCTPSYLSMVENDKLDPSTSRLKRIADALGSTIVQLFPDQGQDDIILRHKDRQKVNVSGSKLLFEILIHQGPDKKMDARLATIYPGGGSGGSYTHPGEEFGYILKGTLELTVEDKTYTLQKGDTFYFHSTRSHQFHNRGDEKVEVLWVNHPPSW
jgi:transcriptional regulator with XRE-family HTH domain